MAFLASADSARQCGVGTPSDVAGGVPWLMSDVLFVVNPRTLRMNRTPKPFALSVAQRSRRAFGKLRAGRINSSGFGFSLGSAFDPAFCFSEKCAQDARPLYRGPCAAVRWGRQARRGIDMDVDSFSPGQESCRKARPHLTDLPGMDARQAPSGVAFSFGYFSLGPSTSG